MMIYKENISENTKTAMRLFITNNEGKNITKEIVKEGKQIIKTFINESTNSYTLVANKIAEVNMKEIPFLLKERKINQLLQSYYFDIEAHTLYERINTIIEAK